MPYLVTINPPQVTTTSSGSAGGSVVKTSGSYFITGPIQEGGILPLAYVDDNGVMGKFNLTLSSATLSSLGADLTAQLHTALPGATIAISVV